MFSAHYWAQLLSEIFPDASLVTEKCQIFSEFRKSKFHM
jgi:hypothetical protein